MKKVKLIALDMDGTLLMSDKTLHPDTAGDIAYAAAKGVHLVYCSGRDICELRPYCGQLPAVRYGICTSGAVIYDFREGRVLHRQAIPRDLILEVIDLVGAQTGMLQFLGDGFSILAEDQFRDLEAYHMGAFAETYQKVATLVPDMRAEAEGHDSIPKMNIYFRCREERDESLARVRHLPLSLSVTDEFTLELTAPGVSKGQGLRILADLLGLTMEETAAIGDSENDRAVLEAAGTAVAMANAVPEIREICDLVTEDNDHNGVGRAIRRLV